jgi:hypothetical protein
VPLNQKPLPESLTRLLVAPPPRAAPTEPHRTKRPAQSEDRNPAQNARHAALEATLLRGFVYGLTGIVWLVVLALTVRHLAR